MRRLTVFLGTLLLWGALPAHGQYQDPVGQRQMGAPSQANAVPQRSSSPLPMEPLHDFGQGVTPAFEGWFKNSDGTFSILFGYFNRNLKEELDIPIGPNNRIDTGGPGDPDHGQPTNFFSGRQWGVFTVTVPADFGDKKITWALTAHGQTNQVPASLAPLWEISPFIEESMGNTPPFLSFSEGGQGPSVQGPRPLTMALTTTAGNPVTLITWVADDAKKLPEAREPKTTPVVVRWFKFRGPGAVTFSNYMPPVEAAEWKGMTAPFIGKATTTATFSEPGEYVLYVVANDWSGNGGRGFQCCWTNGLVKVSVKP